MTVQIDTYPHKDDVKNASLMQLQTWDCMLRPADNREENLMREYVRRELKKRLADDDQSSEDA